jgi:signal transduction histidine kinase
MKVMEKKRLAQEMHDDLGQLLAIIKMDLSLLQQKLPQENYETLMAQISNITQVVDQMTTSIRRTIANYQPCALEKMGLFQALGSLIADYAKRYQMQYEYHFPQPQTALDVKVATAIYRIVQEALNNVVKHSEATRVEVRIDCLDNSIMLNVADNGKGMTNPSHELQQTGSFGIVGMRDRVNALGGRIKFEGKVGAGTIIQVVIPRSALDECK